MTPKLRRMCGIKRRRTGVLIARGPQGSILVESATGHQLPIMDMEIAAEAGMPIVARCTMLIDGIDPTFRLAVRR